MCCAAKRASHFFSGAGGDKLLGPDSACQRSLQQQGWSLPRMMLHRPSLSLSLSLSQALSLSLTGKRAGVEEQARVRPGRAMTASNATVTDDTKKCQWGQMLLVWGRMLFRSCRGHLRDGQRPRAKAPAPRGCLARAHLLPSREGREGVSPGRERKERGGLEGERERKKEKR